MFYTHKKAVSGVLLILLALLLTRATATFAQSDDDLFTFYQGDLWAWSPATGEPERLTEWRYNGGPVLSPDGSKVAYLSWAEEAVVEIESRRGYAGAVPANIWVMYTATRTFERVADQSTFPTFRSIPEWSPDSTQLIWSELRGQQFSPDVSLMTYNFNTRSTRTLSSDYALGFQDGGLYMPPVKWGTGGISRILFTFEDGIQNGEFILEIYNPADGTRREFVVGDTSTAASPVITHFWAEHNGQAQIVLLGGDNQWSVFDISSGTRAALPAAPSLRLVDNPTIRLTPNFVNGGYQWRASYGGQSTSIGYIAPIIENGFLPVLSPEGDYIAWNSEGTTYVWTAEDETVEAILAPGQDFTLGGYFSPQPWSVAWGGMAWVTNTEALPIAERCELPPRLSSGQNAIINPGEPNNVRSQPGTQANRIAQIQAGVTVNVLQGPVCEEGFNWWYIQVEDVVGWTAEGVDGEYWLEPVGYNEPDCANSPLPRLASGRVGVVLPGEPNALRDVPPSAGGQSNVIGIIPAEATFTVISGSVCGSDGRRWWPVEYNGQTGWTAEGEGSTYWLAPAG